MGVVLRLVDPHPGGIAEALGEIEGRGTLHDDLFAGALEGEAVADRRRRAVGAGKGRGVVAVRGRVLRRPVGLAQVIDQHLAGVVGATRLFQSPRSGIVAVVEPDRILASAAGQLGDPDPDQGDLLLRVEFLDMELERHLVVGAHEAKVGAVLLGVGKAEVPRMEPDQHRHIGQVLLDVRPLLRQVEGDLFPVLPLLVPPGVRVEHADHHHQRQGQRHRPRQPVTQPFSHQ